MEGSRKFVLAATVLSLGILHAEITHAKTDQVSNNGAKGLIGLGLLAGEVVVSIEAIAGVKKRWILAVTGIIAAGGGAVGGYFAETAPDNPETGARIGVGLLAAGMALFVPTLIIVTAMTKYTVEKEGRGAEVDVVIEKGAPSQSEVESEGPPSEEAPKGSPPSEKGEESPPPPTGMINLYNQKVFIALPSVQIRPLLFHNNTALFTNRQGWEYQLNLLNLVF